MKKRPQKLLIILCEIEIKNSYMTLRESCSLDVELLTFLIGTGITISLGLQRVCRFNAISRILIYVKREVCVI